MPPSPKPRRRGEPLLRVGVSSCLLGERVRYDGGHRRDAWLADRLGRIAEFVPVCPEVEMGLGVPRPTIRLEADGRGGVLLVEPSSREDLTARMDRWSARRLALLEKADLDGYVLKGNSPSCGPARVKVWTAAGGEARRDGRGLFAEALLRRLPFLPVEEEGGLQDPLRRENFVLRLHAYRRAKGFFRGRWTAGGLLKFHEGENSLLMARDPKACRALGRLVATAKGRPRAEVRAAYLARFMGALEGDTVPDPIHRTSAPPRPR